MQYPYKIIDWSDTETEAKGWIVIDRLINGVSGGGLFMHSNATLHEVSNLAASMSFKNTLQNPLFGGGKGGIRFDHCDPRAKDVLKRFLIDNKETLKTIWCTGADLNTTNTVIEKIVRQYLSLPSAFYCLAKMIHGFNKTSNQAEFVSERISSPLNMFFSIGEASTGYSVAETIRFFYPQSENTRVLIQGFGNVGSSLAYFLQNKKLAKVVGICEKDGFIYSNEGINVEPLIKKRRNGSFNLQLPMKSMLDAELRKKYNWMPRLKQQTDEELLCSFLSHQPAEIFSPCAGRYTITERVISTFATDENRPSLSIISGANNVFSSPDLIKTLYKYNIYAVPEWVSNCGNAILFAETLKIENPYKGWMQDILSIISQRIFDILTESAAGCNHNKYKIFQECISIANNKLDFFRN